MSTDIALRTCLMPGCLRQYDAISHLAGDPPPRPEWSGKGWHTLCSAGIHPQGGAQVCPEHYPLVAAHVPKLAPAGFGYFRAVCGCNRWDSGPYTWHGAVTALWQNHLLEESLKEPS